MMQSDYQIDGTHAHAAIDSGSYSTRKGVMQSSEVYSEQLGVSGKIDLFYADEGLLVERKKHVKRIYPGYVLQVYAQCMALREMGYRVGAISIRSMDDNSSYPVNLPEDDQPMMELLEETLRSMRAFSMHDFKTVDPSKCIRCIYAPICGSTDVDDFES